MASSLFLKLVRKAARRFSTRVLRRGGSLRLRRIPVVPAAVAPRRFGLSPQGRLRRLARWSIAALVAGTPVVQAQAGSTSFGTPAWFAERVQTTATSTSTTSTTSSGGLSATVTSTTEAAATATRSVADLSRAAEMITAAQTAQNAARQLALSQPNPDGVADGLAEGGLVVDADAASDLANPESCGTYACTWINAELPTQTVADDGSVTVTVEQTASQAIMTWDSFNVGRNTTLYFDQSAGNQSDGSNDWIALNRVNATASPSQILGQIVAEGTVYIINPNGIIFGGSSTVDVHSLVATTLNPTYGGGASDTYGSNYAFLTYGAMYTGATWEQPVEDLEWTTDANGNPVVVSGQTEVAVAMGDVTIDAGAVISTGEYGYSLFAAPNVTDAGTIIGDDGTVVLAGGSDLVIKQAATDDDALSVYAGSLSGTSSLGTSLSGTVTVTGLIQAQRGSVQLAASDVVVGSAVIPTTGDEQTGTIVTTTSLTSAGSIVIDADYYNQSTSKGYNGTVLIDDGALLAILPDDSDETTTSTDEADAAFTTGSVTINAAAIRMMGESMIIAPGQDVSLTAHLTPAIVTSLADPIDGSVVGRVYIDSGAIIDVAGLSNVEESVTVNMVSVDRVGLNELADSPLQRGGVLYTASIIVDRRRKGEDDDGNEWIGTPIANVEGYIDQVPRTVDEMLIDGGDITLAGAEVITAEDSFLNLDGGYIDFGAGWVQTTRLISDTGAIVDIADADADTTYVAIAGYSTVEHSRWSISESYYNPLLLGSTYETSYIEGGNGGTLTILLDGEQNATTTTGYTEILNGVISAQAQAGRWQVAEGDLPSGGTLIIGTFDDENGFDSGALSLLLSDDATALADIDADFSYDTDLPEADTTVADPWNDSSLAVYWSGVSTDMIEAAGFSNVSFSTSGIIKVTGSGLTVADGGSITFNASIVTIGADLTALSGDININTYGLTGVTGYSAAFSGASIFASATPQDSALLTGDIVVASGVTLSTRGEYVNDTGLDEDSLTGAAWIDGGSISLIAHAATGVALISGTRSSGAVYGDTQDTTGSVILEAGSTLDVSSGAYVQPDGSLATEDGIALGTAGSITLETYAINSYSNYAQPTTFTDAETGEAEAPSTGKLVLDGTLLAYGFSGGGTLTLQALAISIGEGTDLQLDGTLSLPADWFSNQGFSSYVLQAVYSAAIEDGATVELGEYVLDSQQAANIEALTSAATGSDVYTLTTVGPLTTADGSYDAWHQYETLGAVSFSMYAGGYLDWKTSSGNFASYDCDDDEPCANGELRLGEGASLVGQAGSSIILGSREQLTVLGNIVAHGGSIVLTGDDTSNALYAQPDFGTSLYSYASTSKSVWVGGNAVLDVSGIALIDVSDNTSINASGAAAQTGVVLDGGSISLVDDSGYVIVASGARLDVSGASAVLDLVSDDDASVLVSSTVWSDAGSITLGGAAGLYFDGSISAHGGLDTDGNEAGEGGSLAVTPQSAPSSFTYLSTSTGARGSKFSGATELLITADAVSIPDTLDPGEAVESTPSGTLYFSADVLTNSGIDNLSLGQASDDTASTGAVPIVFSSGTQAEVRDILIDIDGQLTLNASTYLSDSEDDEDFEVTLNAGYVAMQGYTSGAISAPDTPGSRPAGVTLTINADNIDIGGVFSIDGFETVSFNSNNDLRFYTLEVGYALSGMLVTSADLNLNAARTYVATANSFIIDAVGDGSGSAVNFGLAPDGSIDTSVPLSAGASLLVDAATIVQAGNLHLPAGQIVLGVSDPDDETVQDLFSTTQYSASLVETQSVSLADGSVTSVSLDDTVIPYGTTIDGLDYSYLVYGANASDAAILDAPPSGSVTVSGDDVALEDGATVDLSGGGDLQAAEWVSGTGGSLDALSSSYYGDGRTVYAIIPGYEGLAAYDPAYADDPLIGTTVYLSGIDGLEAGYYVLLPASYATLAGAYRIVQDTSALDVSASLNTTLADGSLYVSGYFVDSVTGTADARSTGFIVQSTDEGIWQQYSEYTLTSANDYFTALAEDNGTTVANLLIDAGQLVIAATRQISSLEADIDTAAGEGGAAARIDIASNNIEIVADGATAAEGAVAISVSDLNALQAGSLLIGGTRTRTDEGDVITVVADTVVVNNGDDTLIVPELTVVASDSVTVDAGATLQASGTVTGTAADLIIGSDAAAGDGALLRLSSGDAVDVTRNNSTGMGELSIGADVSLSADGALQLDSAGSTSLDASASLSAAAIEASASNISFVADDSVDVSALDGLVVSSATLAQFSDADSLTLISRGSIDFFGDVSVAVDSDLTLEAAALEGDGGDVSLAAATLTLGNSSGATAEVAAGTGGTLSMQADQLVLEGGDVTVAGFAAVAASSTEAVLAQGEGSIDFGSADVAITAPALVADTGSTYVLNTAGDFSLQASSDASVDDPLAEGGALSVNAATIDIDAVILAHSGIVALTASRGDLTVDDNALIDVSGLATAAFDETVYGSGGTVTLTADSGDLVIAQGASIDVSADDAGGDAGSVTLVAASGDVELAGTLAGSADSGTGGSFTLTSASAQSLDELASLTVDDGFTAAFSVTTGDGNLTLSAGDSIVASSVALVANGGDDLRSADQGQVIIEGTIDASGSAGGDITLYGAGGVQVDGSLLAVATTDGEQGGTVTLGTSGSTDGSYNSEYGYENVATAYSGTLRIGAGAVIDVSGADEENQVEGGTVNLRAPLLDTGDVNISLADTASIVGAGEVSVEVYATWSTADDADATGEGKHFDGIVDPAGLYDADGNALDGSTNAAHQTFYADTLLGYVQDPGWNISETFAGIDNVVVRAGIDLVNPDGDIQVLSNWNLGAGSENADGSLDLLYRTDGVAPVLSLLAAGNLLINASISDGFFQYGNPFSTAAGTVASTLDSDNANGISPVADDDTPLPLLAMTLAAQTDDDNIVIANYDSSSYRLVAGYAGSVDPLVVDGDSSADVVLDAHTSATIYDDDTTNTSRTMVSPTMVRTGSGSIAVVASGDITLADETSPGVIYTGGRAAIGSTLTTAATVVDGNGVSGTDASPWIVDTGESHPVDAGDLTLIAGGDISGQRNIIDTTGAITGVAGTVIDEYWWPWMQGLCALIGKGEDCGSDTSTQDYSLINFGNFRQGVLSAGGTIRVTAGGSINEFSISSPTTYVKSDGSLTTYGGGNVTVIAAEDILGSDVFVASGTGRVVAGGEIGDVVDEQGDIVASTRLALQDAQIFAQSRLDMTLADILNPSYMNSEFDLTAYSTDSSVTLRSTAGDLWLGFSTGDYDWGSDLVFAQTSIWPATVDAAAVHGDLTVYRPRTGLFPSATGNLSLIAGNDLTITMDTGAVFGLIDVDPQDMLSPLNPSGTLALSLDSGTAAYKEHSEDALHAEDDSAVILYALDGDLVMDAKNGVQSGVLVTNKKTRIRAGRDIVNLRFVGQNLYASDVTLIQAGRDLVWDLGTLNALVEIGGPGTLLVSAGRNIKISASYKDTASGIFSVGNNYNPYLPRGEGADIVVEFGVADGVDLEAFLAAYVAPDRSVDDVPEYSDELIAYMLQVEQDDAAREGREAATSMTADQAWTLFQTLPETEQRVFVYQVLYDILDSVGLDYNDPDSEYYEKYARGYAAISTLFPARLGYTLNGLEGGTNGAEQTVETGTLDMRDATIQTQQGGNISFIGPGGDILVGSVLTPENLTPSDQGILALQNGDINIFLDGSLLLAQSRIFTLDGGDLLIWSSNGDINAGRGAKTTTELATLSFTCESAYHYCVVDSAGQVSGAGIAALQVLGGEQVGSANLIAPRGTVDAGDAGIRATGNLNVAAAAVANADNIDVGGSTVGVPTGAVDSGALSSATAAAAAATAAAEDMARQNQGESAATTISVDVLGYGQLSEEQKRRLRRKQASDSGT